MLPRSNDAALEEETMPSGKDLIRTAQETMSATPIQKVRSALQANENLVVLDVREKEEWDAGHIDGAVHVSRGRIEGRIEELVPDKSTAIICH